MDPTFIQENGINIIKAHRSNMGALADKISELLDQGQRKFILDLENIEWIDSQGLGKLMSYFNTIRNAEGQLVIASPSEQIVILFNMTKLDRTLVVFDNLESAKASFN